MIGRQPIGLSATGREQCRSVVPLLRALGAERIVTSPLLRARETAEIVAGALELPLGLDAGLAELDFGSWEGRCYDDLLTDPHYDAFSRRPQEVAPPGGETALAAQQRALDAVARALAMTPAVRVCVVSHGDVIRLVLAAYLALTVGEFRRLRIDTCGVSGVEVTEDWAEVRFVNLVADTDRVHDPLHWGRR